MVRRMRSLRRALRTEWRTHGARGMLRRRGWRFVAAVFVVYLVRDLMLYVAIPAVAWMAVGP